MAVWAPSVGRTAAGSGTGAAMLVTDSRWSEWWTAVGGTVQKPVERSNGPGPASSQVCQARTRPNLDMGCEIGGQGSRSPWGSIQVTRFSGDVSTEYEL